MTFFRIVLCAGLLTAAGLWGGDVPLDASSVVLLSDLHLTHDPNNPHQRAGFSRCVRDVLALNPRPANALFFGDLSFNHGETNDYRLLKELVRPLEDAGIRWTACFGNHDRRAPFFAVFPERQTPDAPVSNRLVSVVRTPHADFILLDSCLEGPTHGDLDDAQRAWLSQTLARETRPAFVCAHHSIGETGVAPLMATNACCAAYLHGHEHMWRHRTEHGVETLCLPSTGHWGDIGFVVVRLTDDGATFTLRQYDFYTPRPAAHPEGVKPEWKARVRANDGDCWRVSFKRP
jgi:3',5'-cyclic AMP phosphodiesterase CpdA